MLTTIKFTSCFALLLLFLTGNAGAQMAIQRAEILDYGIYVADIPRTELAPETPTGKTSIIESVRFIRTTDRIPMKQGTRFGLRYVVYGQPVSGVVALTKKVTFPSAGLRDPKSGRVLTSYETRVSVKLGEPTVTGYGLDEQWEMVPGEWTFEIIHGGTPLLLKRFILVE